MPLISKNSVNEVIDLLHFRSRSKVVPARCKTASTRDWINTDAIPKLARLTASFTWHLTDPISFGPGIRTQLGSLSKVIPFGSHPKNLSCKRVGSDPNWYG